MRRLMREITQLRSDPPEGIRIVTDEENLLDVTGIIAGPGKSLFNLEALSCLDGR
jgi:ubiquitin-conjugating enzyme E2 S